MEALSLFSKPLLQLGALFLVALERLSDGRSVGNEDISPHFRGTRCHSSGVKKPLCYKVQPEESLLPGPVFATRAWQQLREASDYMGDPLIVLCCLHDQGLTADRFPELHDGLNGRIRTGCGGCDDTSGTQKKIGIRMLKSVALAACHGVGTDVDASG